MTKFLLAHACAQADRESRKETPMTHNLTEKLTQAEYRQHNQPNVIFGDSTTKRVWSDGAELSPEASWTMSVHSPDGFAWSYGGSGPSQLTLAIPLEFTDKASRTLSRMTRFG